VRDTLRWLVFDDRQMYRPGEEVHFKGWIRRVGGGETGDVGPLQGAASRVYYRLIDSQGNDVHSGSLSPNALGGFDLALTLPDGMNLGYTTLYLIAEGAGDLEGREYHHPFQVQEFRRPEFEVSASASEGPHIVGGHAIASVTANYYAGGVLPNAEVNWQVTSMPGHFAPPNWDDFTFGRWTPWWSWDPRPYGRGERVQTHTD
jgi:alpha-2-macroglobulin